MLEMSSPPDVCRDAGSGDFPLPGRWFHRSEAAGGVRLAGPRRRSFLCLRGVRVTPSSSAAEGAPLCTSAVVVAAQGLRGAPVIL